MEEFHICISLKMLFKYYFKQAFKTNLAFFGNV